MFICEGFIMKVRKHQLTILAVSVLGIGSPWLVHAAPTAPDFATMPLRLQESAQVTTVSVKQPLQETETQIRSVTSTTTTAPGVKPNVMLFLDNSGSMQGSRIRSLRNVMNNVVSQNADKVNWGLTAYNYGDRYCEWSFFGNCQKWSNGVDRPMGTPSGEIIKTINDMPVNGGTPTTLRYLVAAERLGNAISYRCQKNYLVLMSDGDANGGSWMMINDMINRSDFWYQTLGNYYGLESRNTTRGRALYNDLVSYMTVMSSPFVNQQQFAYYPYQGVVDLGTANNQGGLTPTSYLIGYDQLAWSHNRFYLFHRQSYINRYAGDMLRYLSKPLDSGDLKQGGTDGFGKSWDDPMFKDQTITTFTISFGGDSSASGVAHLKGGATPEVIDGKGNKIDSYFTADDETKLLASFNKIFETIASQNPPPVVGQPTTTINTSTPTGSTTSPVPPQGATLSIASEDSYATTSPGVVGGSAQQIPNMAATVYLPAGLRSSELRFYDLDSRGNVIKDATGTAKYHLARFDKRRALINSGNSVDWVDNPSSATLSNDFFNLTMPDIKGRNNEWKKALLPWITRTGGLNDNEIRALNYPTDYRVRGGSEYAMGDVLDTPVLAAGNEVNGRQEFIVTAANDGMVYFFQSQRPNPDDPESTKPYSLALNYLPASMPRSEQGDILAHHYQDVAHSLYTEEVSRPHQFMINGGAVLRTAIGGGNKQIFMVGNMGQGARGMYALNVGGQDVATGKPIALNNTNYNQWRTEVPLFEVTGGNSAQKTDGLGYTVGSPQVGRIGIQYTPDNQLASGTQSGIRYAAFLSSGYGYPHFDDQETALYIYDVLGSDVGSAAISNPAGGTGSKDSLLRKINVAGGRGGLSTPTLLDVNLDGVVDYAFAGDLGGNMYRFDLRKINQSDAEIVKKIYTGDKKQPISAAPAVARRSQGRFVVTFGTGIDIYNSDLTNKDQQAVYGIYQRFDSNNNPIALNDAAGATQPERVNQVTQADLLTQNLSTDTNHQFRTVTDNSIVNADDKNQLNYPGWKVSLNANDGERVVVKPEVLLGTVVLSTRIYREEEKPNQNHEPWDENTWLQNGWKALLPSTDTAKQVVVDWTPWSEIPGGGTSSSTNTQSADDLCLGETSSNSKKEQRQITRGWDKITRYQRTNTGSIHNSGWILSLDVDNGGGLSTGNKANQGGDPLDFGIDFGRQFSWNSDNNTLQAITGSLPDYFYAGVYVDGGIPNATLLTGNKTQYAVTADGDSGGSGEDPDFGSNIANQVGRTDCLVGESNFLLPQNSQTGLGNTFSAFGRICAQTPKGPPIVKRISWREII